MGHEGSRTRSGHSAAAAGALAALALVCGCAGVPPSQVHTWKPQAAHAATTRPGTPVTRAIVRPGTQVTPQEVLEESHRSTPKTVWCAVPGPGGKMIWVQVK